jgi:predicted protein tyrosine phosphatase
VKKLCLKSDASIYLKRILFLISLLIIIAFSVSSCEEPIGKWDDNIKLSTRYVEFNAKADSAIITTQGDWWWIDGISANDSTYQYHNRKDINLESDSYTIKEDFFVVERRDKNTLFVKFEENLTKEERLMIIGLEAGDYFDYVKIKQLAK